MASFERTSPHPHHEATRMNPADKHSQQLLQGTQAGTLSSCLRCCCHSSLKSVGSMCGFEAKQPPDRQEGKEAGKIFSI